MAAPPKTLKAAGSGRQQAEASGSQQQAATGAGSRQETGIYVYGIVPGDVELAAEVAGVGDPPGQVRVVRWRDLAALVSEVDLPGRLGSPNDMRAHMQILDATAAVLPVLPLRFGAVVAGEDAVAGELLAPHHDEFAAALDELDGRAEFLVKGRYAQQAILAEILSHNPHAARLRDQIQGVDEIASREVRIRLGEIINATITAQREHDTRALGQAMDGHCIASVVREPTHEMDAVYVAFLAEAGQQSGMQQVIEDLAREWEGRVELRLLGPMAAYDFAATTPPEG